MIAMRYFLILLLSLFVGTAFGQAHKIDMLDTYYNQTHFKKVYTLSKKLVDNPENDFSMKPRLFLALSMLQLAENKVWLRTHPLAMNEAREIILELKKRSDGVEVMQTYERDIASLKADLMSRLGDYKASGRDKDFDQLNNVVVELFGNINTSKVENNDQIASKPVKPTPTTSFKFNPKDLDEMVLYAKQQLGVKYVHGGTTPKGFDCSGYTTYIFQAYKINLPRRAVDQYDKSVKVKEKDVKKGDLVFFDSGNGVNHVGMIISEKGESPVMIHASTSQGIVVTDIMKSDYWKKRLKGYGTYLN